MEAKKARAVVGISMKQDEERTKGAVTQAAYEHLLEAAMGLVDLLIFIVASILMLVSIFLASYWLVSWQEKNAFYEPQGLYVRPSYLFLQCRARERAIYWDRPIQLEIGDLVEGSVEIDLDVESLRDFF